ncbi:MAG: hypothetical protein IJS50_04275, partial [Desulfovibrio sp.]|nr:hypothetical protein [Desulfovibrio sp.]
MNMHSAEDKSSLKTKLQQFFNPQEYICFKALQYFQKKENGGYSAERIRENLPFFAAKIVKAFKSAGISPFSHYRKYGTRECINPSNAFNTLAYLKAKAQALNQAGHKNNGRPWDANAIAQVLARKQVSALEHFLQFAGRGPNEVPYGLTPKGEIPAQFVVGRSEQVSLESYSGKTIELTPVVKTAPKDAKQTVKQKAKPLVNPKKAAPKPEPPIPPAKDYFSAPEYFAFKALQYFQLKENGGLSPEQIRADLPKYVNFIFQYFQKLNLDPWDHYRKFGSFEGINPSNAFDTISYLQAKAVALNKAGKKQGDKPWDAQAVAQAFRQANTTALEHFLRFAGKGPGEVEHGLTEDGQIPEDFAVPDVLHVPRVPLFKEQVTEPPKKEQPVPPKEVKTPVPVNAKNVPSVQSSGRRAVELKPETDDLAVKDDHDTIPEYYFNLLPKKTVLQGFVVGVGHNIWHRSLASRLILLTVILPGIFIFFYLLFWATPAYISETKFAVRGQSNNQSMEGFSAFFNLPNAGMSDSYIVLN